MVILIYAFATLFIFMAVVMMFTYHRSPQRGVMLLGITYGLSAVVALVLMQAWPLLAGLLIAFGLRALGFDPAPRFREPPVDEKPESKRENNRNIERQVPSPPQCQPIPTDTVRDFRPLADNHVLGA